MVVTTKLQTKRQHKDPLLIEIGVFFVYDKIFVAGNVHTVWGKAQYVNQQDYDGYLIYGKEEEVWFPKDLDQNVKNIPE